MTVGIGHGAKRWLEPLSGKASGGTGRRSKPGIFNREPSRTARTGNRGKEKVKAAGQVFAAMG
jgi:hypothetical protein